jgi:hypothetical protein
MGLTVLAVPNCPHAMLLEQRLVASDLVKSRFTLVEMEGGVTGAVRWPDAGSGGDPR